MDIPGNEKRRRTALVFAGLLLFAGALAGCKDLFHEKPAEGSTKNFDGKAVTP
jgi:hypothetical protein